MTNPMCPPTNPECPTWPGASACYSRAYRLLDAMGQAEYRRLTSGKNSKLRGRFICRTDDMDALIEALNSGDEQQIKALLLDHLILGTHPEAWKTPR